MSVYLITGASSDVGTALIDRLYREGDVFIAQGAGDLSHLAPLCRKYPGAIKTYDVDLTDPAALELFVRDVAARYPTPTHLVHLPALRVVNTRFKNFDEDRFERDMSVQIRSAVKLCKTFLPAMAKARQGRVLFMLTSYLLGAPPKNTAAYVMVKSTLQGLAKSLAADYASFGVTVNCVAPGVIDTDMMASFSAEDKAALAEETPLGALGTPKQVADALVFLAGDGAGYITGQVFGVNGGLVI